MPSLSRFTMPLAIAALALAEDWPEWRGAGRGGVWRESGIVDRFAGPELKAEWRVPLRAGFAGPAVAAGRVFVTDFALEGGEGPGAGGRKGIERLLCLDQRTGKVLWSREWPADYRGISYAIGPRATPTVDQDRVYVVGASGLLICLRAASGEVVWRKDFVKDYGLQMPVWGIASAPLIDGPRLITIAGGQPNAKVIALDKLTGEERWRALSSQGEPGYGQPVLAATGAGGGKRQLIVWHPAALSSLDPVTGKTYWETPFSINAGMTLATPVLSGTRILVSSFYNGSMLVDLAGQMLWKGKSDNEIKTDGLHAVINTPVIDGDHIYGICSYGQFRCLDLRSGQRVWETMDVTREKARWASGFIVRQGDRYFINNDRGELIIARFSPAGYQEISRAKLIKPTSNSGNRRELGAVNWSHPAYANRRIYARNDEEIIAVRLDR